MKTKRVLLVAGEVSGDLHGASLVEAIRRLEKQIGQPLTLAECGITRPQLEAEMDTLAWNALGDAQTVMSTRIPGEEDVRRLFFAAWDGAKIDF